MNNKFTLTFLLLSALLLMGAKWVEKPIQDFQSIAGEWRGSGYSASGGTFSLIFVFKPDGAYAWTISGRDGKGTMRLEDGRIEWNSVMTGDLVTVTLHEKKGKRIKHRWLRSKMPTRTETDGVNCRTNGCVDAVNKRISRFIRMSCDRGGCITIRRR